MVSTDPFLFGSNGFCIKQQQRPGLVCLEMQGDLNLNVFVLYSPCDQLSPFDVPSVMKADNFSWCTLFILSIGTPYFLTVLVLKFEKKKKSYFTTC